MDKCERCGGPLNECSLCGPSRDVAAELLADLVIECFNSTSDRVGFGLMLTLSQIAMTGALVTVCIPGGKLISAFMLGAAVVLWPWKDIARIWRTRHGK